MAPWVQYTLVRSRGGGRLDPGRANYQLLRESLLPIFERHAVGHSLVLNYFGRGNDVMRCRVEASGEALVAVEADLARLVESGAVLEVHKEEWSPDKDAANRIRDVAANLRAGGAYDLWILGGLGLAVPRSHNAWVQLGMWGTRTDPEMATDFAKILVLAGDWAREFAAAFPERPAEGFLMSMLVHLLLNSLGFTGPDDGEEAAIRLTPLVP